VLTGGGAARGVAGSDAHRRGRRGAEEAGRDVGRHEVGRRRVGRREVGSRRVGQATWGWVAWGQELRCWSSNVGSGGWRGASRAGGEDARGVGRLGVQGSVGLLGPGDGSLVYQSR
jgi:hypothetical protein